MRSCYRQLRSSCPISCEKIEYTVQKSDRKRIANRVDVKLQFASTDIAMHNEVLIQEFGNFIGTVGGSLGLFIGFSYTGFVGQLIDYFMWDDMFLSISHLSILFQYYLQPTWLFIKSLYVYVYKY